MEILLRSATAACFYFAVREASGGRKVAPKTLALMGLAFVWSSAEDLRYLFGLGFIFVRPWEYPAVAILQGMSLVFFLLALRSAKASNGP